MLVVKEVVRIDASDVYLKVGSPPMFRVDGVTRAASDIRLTVQDMQALVDLVMDPSQKQEFQRVSEMNLAVPVPGVGRFRANIYRQRGSIAMVMRRIKLDIPKLEVMGLPGKLLELALLKNGLVLVVGATGSGKSTTLAGMIGYRNRMKPGHIVTIEDPVEFLHRDEMSIVSQREVGTDTQSFDSALRNALRQAPDVILIGEMRDAVSVEAALAFAETGHLVISTLHSTNASQTIERLLQFFPSVQHGMMYQSLSNNLRAVVAQRLVPRSDGGRVAAVEILMVTPLIRDYLRRQETSAFRATMVAGKKDGMQTFDEHLFELYTSGAITQQTAVAFADSASEVRLRLRGLSG